MLLFLLHENFRELPEPAPPVVVKFRGDSQAILGAGLFVTVWCTLRLLAGSGEGPSFDVGLAVACWCVGAAATVHGCRGLLR
jgi:hypothetical protein